MRSGITDLVLLAPGFPRDESDSACLPAQQVFVRSLRQVCPELQITIFAWEYPYHSSPYHWHGVRVIPFNAFNRSKLAKLILACRMWIQLKQQLRRKKNVGLLSFWCTECALFGKYFARWYGLRHFIWILGQDAAKGNRFVRWIRPKADELLAMSDFLARCFEENYGIRPARIIPNGVDKNLFAPAPNDRDIDLMGVGSLIPLKQYELFVGIAKSLRPAFPGLKAVICGNGPERTKIETLIAAESLTDTITLKGELPHQEVLRLMQRARVFLHPSSFEGFPTACLEALYAGAHVISFVSPMQAWINHWHVVDSVEEMAEKSLEILQDPDADHHSVAPFLMKESASLVLQLYRSNPSEIL